MKVKILGLENQIAMQLQNNQNVSSLKEQLETTIEENEKYKTSNDKLEKELAKIKSDKKEIKIYSDSLDSELKAIKVLGKERDQEISTVKQECAAALLAKEKSNQHKIKDLDNEIVDLKFEVQKYIQKINDLESHISK